MGRSLLAAVHNAVVGADDDTLVKGETGAAALSATTKEGAMSKDSQPAGGETNSAGISQATHDAAVASARADGKAEGEKSVTERFNAALGAEGVKGDAGRMAAALDLAVKSPSMAGADVAAFVVANVAAATASNNAATTYASKRVEASGLAQPGNGELAKKATVDTKGIYASRRQQAKEA
jgi:hypothetical protein